MALTYGPATFLLLLHLCQGVLAAVITTSDPRPFNISDFPPAIQERETTEWKGPDYVLHITSEPITLSCQERVSTLVNGQHPGPLLRFQEKQTKWVRVYNHLAHDEDTVTATGIAMHWHGIDVPNNHDGTPETQYLISPGYFRDYKITPPTGSAGSYLYHDHAMSFGASTATGPIIIDPAVDTKAPFDYDDDHSQTEKGLLAAPLDWTGEARNILINGKGYASYEQVWMKYKLDPSLLEPPLKRDTCEIEVIRVTAGKTYRFRFISGTVMTLVTFATKSIDKKPPMTVIEADGTYTEGFPTDRVSVGSGQRYSVLFKAPSAETYRGWKEKGEATGFWLEGREMNRLTDTRGPILIWIQVEDPDEEKETQLAPMQGIIKDPDGNREYTDMVKFSEFRSSVTGIKFKDKLRADLPLKPLSAYADFPSSDQVTATVTLQGVDVGDENGAYRWTLNGHSYFGPKGGVPGLLAAANDWKEYSPNPVAFTDKSHFDLDHNLYAFKKGDVIDIIIENLAVQAPYDSVPVEEGDEFDDDDYECTDGEFEGGTRASDSHPFHLHGAHYFDLGAGPGRYSKGQVEKNIRNGKVLKRDTSMLYKYNSGLEENTPDGWRAMRIRVESLGVWLLHCHMLQHMLTGMTAAFVFGEPDDIKALPDPEVVGWKEKGERNVYSIHDKKAKPGDRVQIGKPFGKLDRDAAENLGEKLSQGAFGVKAVG